MDDENDIVIHDLDDDSEDDVVEEDYPDSQSDDDPEAESGDHQQEATSSVTDHSYLGEMEEVRGRTMFDEEEIVEVPVLVQDGLVCVPGQTLPLNISHPHIMAMMRNIIDSNRTFGILSFRPMDPYMKNVKFRIGTTAEVFEYSQPDEVTPFGVCLRIKATVRQRFKVLSARRQIDGILMARVRILPENELKDSPFKLANEWDASSLKTTPSWPRVNQESHAHCSVWPSWVYKSYDVNHLANEVLTELQKSVLINVKSNVNISKDPLNLSYWVVQNLPLEDEQRLKLLSLNNPIQRLRAELSILQRCEYLCCRECDFAIAKQSDVFCLSRDGPHGVYVNPFGHVHETLTVHQVDGIRIVSRPSTEFSWFPGYAWSIIQCAYCENHMGWRFTATNKQLKPKKFWGLCRTSLKPRLKQDEEGQKFEMIL